MTDVEESAIQLSNSSYRGIRFSFRGSVRQAYWHYLALPLLAGLSLYS